VQRLARPDREVLVVQEECDAFFVGGHGQSVPRLGLARPMVAELVTVRAMIAR